jgi:hypothetical protein
MPTLENVIQLTTSTNTVHYTLDQWFPTLSINYSVPEYEEVNLGHTNPNITQFIKLFSPFTYTEILKLSWHPCWESLL